MKFLLEQTIVLLYIRSYKLTEVLFHDVITYLAHYHTLALSILIIGLRDLLTYHLGLDCINPLAKIQTQVEWTYWLQNLSSGHTDL